MAGKRGVRTRNWVDPKTREKIKATQLLNRLQAYALGENEKGSDKPIVMAPAQVKAAQVLLAKVLPDLSSSEVVNNTQDNLTKEELYLSLVKLVGDELARKLAPAFAIEKREEKVIN